MGNPVVCREVFMVRPSRFEFNYQTAHDNVFQQEPSNGLIGNTQAKALAEFDAVVQLLRKNGIQVIVGQDTPNPHTPDSIFPTNWVSTLPDGTLCLYPMEAKNRRMERKPFLTSLLLDTFVTHRVIDFTEYENNGKYLEGAGSVVVDYPNGIAYACISGRTHHDLVEKFLDEIGITKSVIFHARDENGIPIYHTDVMMAIADKYVIVCLESIQDAQEKKLFRKFVEESGKEIVEISFKQLHSFVGNMVQLQNSKGENFAIMSGRAYKSLTESQKAKLLLFNQVLHLDIPTIEEIGGGSVQCLMAKIYLQRQT